ncbi:hypothetical protein [Salinivibrio socompensis]|uniref:hypothetical protein n=1 Tax=Salinivibrio socompensis TaxID=1510206 RepID=UPI00047084ED|nr:hypothetical protein [Salinivibrio socompensis]
MDTKELNAVLDRIQSAKRCTKPLLEKTKAFANFIEAQMDDLGVNRLMNGKYQLRTIRTSVGSDTSLYLKTDIDEGYDWLYVCLDVSNVDSDRDCFYLWGDFNAAYHRPNRDDIFEFIADAESLLFELADLEKTPNTEVLENALR